MRSKTSNAACVSGPLCVWLLGKLEICAGKTALDPIEAIKARELLSYLLLHPRRPHNRATLARLLWPDCATERAKKYLRQALWQTQTAFEPAGLRVLQAEQDWIEISDQADLWTDVGAIERTFHALPRSENDRDLEEAITLYRGELLEGWEHNWCSFERYRVQQMYFVLVDRLLERRIAAGHYVRAIDLAMAALRHDHAREQLHATLMTAYAAIGDRTSAMRQYDRCVAALDSELGVTPSPTTVALSRRIGSGAIRPEANRTSIAPHAADRNLLERTLEELAVTRQTLSELEQRILGFAYVERLAANTELEKRT